MIAPRWRAVAVTVAGAIVSTSRRIMSSLAQQSYAGLGAPHRTRSPRGASEPVLPPQVLARVSNRPRHDERLTDPIAPLLDVPYAATRGLRVVNMAGQKDGMGARAMHRPHAGPTAPAARRQSRPPLRDVTAAPQLPCSYLTELNKTPPNSSRSTWQAPDPLRVLGERQGEGRERGDVHPGFAHHGTEAH